MRKTTFAVHILALATACFPAPSTVASEDNIPAAILPSLPQAASRTAEFAPAGWIVEAQATGDLNGDGLDDIAFVLHETDQKNFIPTSGDPGASTLDANPRILAVAFGMGQERGYWLALQNHVLIPRRISSAHDAFEGSQSLSIRSGALRLVLSYFSSAGGWDMGNRTLKFRYRNRAFVLVGYEGTNLHRATGETRATSVNFLSGRAWMKTGSVHGEASTVRRFLLDAGATPTLDEVSDGLRFDPLAKTRATR